MPVEIREIVIKTEISTGNGIYAGTLKEKELNLLKKQLLEECKRILSESAKRNSDKR